MHCVPPVGGMIANSKLFIAAKPNPCSHSSDSTLPCHRNAQSFSRRVPHCVFWLVWGSGFLLGKNGNLHSSLLIMAIFL